MSVFGALSDRARRFLNRRLHYRDCFCDPSGELTVAGAFVIRDLARKSGAYRTTFKVSPVTRTADPLAMSYAEGRRSLFLELQAMLQLPDAEVLKALNEDNPND